jgi:hypothetical protein
MSVLMPTNLDPLDAERLSYENFARTYSAPEYRDLLVHLYATWHEFNDVYFEGGLRVPHISIGRTTPRRMSHCQRNTSYGAQLDITISASVAFGTNTRLVRNPWPSQGLMRFLDDLVLAETVKQSVLELQGHDEEGYGGYGPRYATEATRIGRTIGLPQVTARHRGRRGVGHPVAALWPWAFRPDDYYLGHVRFDHLAIGGRRSRNSVRRDVLPGVFEYLHFLMITGREARVLEILGREVDGATVRRNPAVAEDERGPRDAHGKLLSIPTLDPAWMLWNGGCIRHMAEAIRDRRAFDGMPILADALEDAGCNNQQVLDHCRLLADHTAECWVLKAIRTAAEKTETTG